MTEETLSSSINRAATKRAEKIIDNIKRGITTSLKDKFRQKEASNEFIREDIINVLENYLKYLKSPSQQNPESPKPTETLINGCRAKILNDLIDNLPKINDLLKMLPEENKDD